jgi:ATP-dependent 26S proteasome regulatory subunit
MVESILQAATAGSQDERKEAAIQKLNEMIQAMEAGPLRYATFLKLLPPRNGVTRAHVALQDGTSAYTVLAEESLADSLRCGDTVVLEAQGRALLFHDPDRPDTGEEARLERRVDRERVQVSLRDHDRYIFRASAPLIEKLDGGEVTPGSSLLVCPRRFLAFDSLPKQDGLSHYRYLAKDSVPDVVIERDIGSPPAFLEELVEHVRMEMLTPELGRRYRLRRAVMKMLTGVSGSGKTLCIQGFWRRLYELMAEVTGASLDQLPRRVLRLRMAQVLSKWLGDSDKQLDRFFDEVEEIADKTFTAPNGEEFELPVLVICEEADGLARTRGEEAIYDRIQTTLLQRLDTTCQKVGDKLVIFLFTTNVPHLVDPAFLRRAGGTTERFGRLTKRSFQSVLTKHLRGLPLAGANGDADGARREVIAEVSAWFFSPNGSDAGQVELLYAGSTTPDVKYRRDFLTGALVDRAVQQAAAEACRAERLGVEEPGVTANLLIRTFDRQVRSIVEQLHRDNVANYVTLPEGARVANVRRLEQPTVLPFELERIA